ncbi:uncharacterized protein LOC144479638 [Mustelus asterias]
MEKTMVQEENTRLKKVLQTWEAKAKTLDHQLLDPTSLRKEVTGHDQTIAELQKQINGLIKENTNQQADLELCKNKISRMENQLSRKTVDLQRTEREAEQLKLHSSRLNSRIYECENEGRTKQKNNSWLTILLCISGYCLGFGSCYECN